MLRRSSPHVHTQFCDGQSTAEEMVLSAIAHDFVSLGFSSHARQDFDLDYALDEADERDYLAEIGRLQARYAGDLRIWRGMERDSLAIAEREPFEYVIASVHYIACADGSVFPVDGEKEMVKGRVRAFFGGEGIRLAQTYYRILGEYVRTCKPDIIGHFDLVMKNNRDGLLFDESSPVYIKAATDAMDAAIAGCSLMEVNTGAIARSGAPGLYPDPSLLAYWRSIGGEVILSSDCHLARDIAAGYEAGEAAIRKAGYQKAAFLGRRDELFEWCRL